MRLIVRKKEILTRRSYYTSNKDLKFVDKYFIWAHPSDELPTDIINQMRFNTPRTLGVTGDIKRCMICKNCPKVIRNILCSVLDSVARCPSDSEVSVKKNRELSEEEAHNLISYFKCVQRNPAISRSYSRCPYFEKVDTIPPEAVMVLI